MIEKAGGSCCIPRCSTPPPRGRSGPEHVQRSVASSFLIWQSWHVFQKRPRPAGLFTVSISFSLFAHVHGSIGKSTTYSEIHFSIPLTLDILLLRAIELVIRVVESAPVRQSPMSQAARILWLLYWVASPDAALCVGGAARPCTGTRRVLERN